VNRDRLTAARRSWNMSRIKGKHTAPELLVRSALHRMGYRFRLHAKIPIPGRDAVLRRPRPRTSGRNRGRSPTLDQRPLDPRPSPLRFVRPDIILPKYKTVIFVHGCFWHRHRGCKNCTTPTHRREWWLAKLEGNAARDKKHQRALRKLGWRVNVIWECQCEKRKSLAKLNRQLKNLLAARIPAEGKPELTG